MDLFYVDIFSFEVEIEKVQCNLVRFVWVWDWFLHRLHGNSFYYSTLWTFIPIPTCFRWHAWFRVQRANLGKWLLIIRLSQTINPLSANPEHNQAEITSVCDVQKWNQKFFKLESNKGQRSRKARRTLLSCWFLKG